MAMSRKRWVLPGFGITMGFTLLYLSLIVLIPLSTVWRRLYQPHHWTHRNAQRPCHLLGL